MRDPEAMRSQDGDAPPRLPRRDATRRAVPAALAAWTRLVTARPILTLLVVAALTLAAAIPATRLGVDTDTTRMIAEDAPFRQRTAALREAFPETANAVAVVVRSEVADAADAAAAALAATLRAREDAVAWVFAPSAEPYLVSHGLMFLPLDTLEQRLSRLSQAADLLAALRADPTLGGFLDTLSRLEALTDQAGAAAAELDPLYAETAAVLAADRLGEPRPFGWTGAFGGDAAAGATRVVSVGPRFDYEELQPAKAALAAVREAVAGLDPALAEAVEIGVTGDPALRAEELSSVTESLTLSMALSALLVAGLLRWGLGSTARAALAFGALVVTLTLTAGFAGLAVGSLNLVSAAFVVLMTGLGIDYAIHYVAHVDELRAKAESRRAAVLDTARETGPALLLSATTTALAFLAFATTDFVGMAQLGVIGGAGVMIAFAVTLTVAPAALALKRGPTASKLAAGVRKPSRRLRRASTVAAIVIGLAGLAATPWARFAADPMALRNPDAPSVRTYETLAASPQLTPLRLSVMTADAAAAEAAAARLEALPEVAEARWLGDFVPRDQAAKLELIDLAYPSLLHAVEGEPSGFAAGPAPPSEPEALAARLEEREGAATAALAAELRAYAARRSAATDAALERSLFLLFPNLIERLSAQLDAGEATLETLPEIIRSRYVSEDGRWRVELTPAADARDPEARRDFVRAVHAVAPEAAGPPDQIAGAADAVARAIAEATALALLGCAALAWASVRDVARTAAILAPLALAMGATVGASVLFDLPFNYANVIVLPLLIGVGVDSGVHVALRSSATQGSVFDTSTPRAVIFSALTTVAAFGTLALSSHRGTASMGILLAIAVAAAVGMTFAVTPALIRLGRRLRGEPS